MTKKDTNICKAFAAVLLLCHHLFVPYSAPFMAASIQYDWLITPVSLTFLAEFGKVCVSIFVFLSGYGIAKSCSLQKLHLEDPAVYVSYTAKRFVSLLTSFQLVFLLFFSAGLGLSFLPGFPEGANPIRIFSLFTFKGPLYFMLDFLGISYLFGAPTLNATWWYIPFALMLIVTIPLLVIMCRKLGDWILVPSFFLTRYIFSDQNFSIYFFVAIVGVVIAQSGLFERLSQVYRCTSLFKKAALVLLLLTVSLISALYRVRCMDNSGLHNIFDSLFTISLCGLIAVLIGRIPILSDILAWIGSHSMNIFLTHTFLFSYWFPEYTYSFRHPIVILAVLLAETLCISVLLEALKKKISLDQVNQQITSAILRHIAPHINAA